MEAPSPGVAFGQAGLSRGGERRFLRRGEANKSPLPWRGEAMNMEPAQSRLGPCLRGEDIVNIYVVWT